MQDYTKWILQIVTLATAFLSGAAKGSATTPIQIALLSGFTGVASIPSYHLRSAIEMEVAEINRRGGVKGKPLELVVLDDNSNPVKTAELVQDPRLDQVAAVIGFPWSIFIQAGGPILQQRKIPTISFLATHDKVPDIGDYIFRICFSNAYQGTKLAEYAYRKVGVRRAILLVNQQNSYSVDLAKTIRSTFESIGGTIIKTIDYVPEHKSPYFLEMLAQVDPASYEGVFLPDDQVYVLPILDALRERQLVEKKLFGGDGWNMGTIQLKDNRFREFHAYVVGHWLNDERVPRNKPFVRAFRQRYPSDPQDASALAHDAFHVLVKALEAAPTLKHEDIRTALQRVTLYGLTGRIQFSSRREPSHKPLVIYHVHRGDRTAQLFQ